MESVKEATGEEVKVEEIKQDNKTRFMTIFTYITIAVVCFTLGGAFGYCIGNRSKDDTKTTIKEDKAYDTEPIRRCINKEIKAKDQIPLKSNFFAEYTEEKAKKHSKNKYTTEEET